MKKTLTLLVMLLATAGILSAQTQKFPYQAVVRNADTLVHDTEIPMTVTVYNGDVTSPAIYVETHTQTSTKNGLVSINIGAGTVQSGSFNLVDWSIATIKVDFEVGGNTLSSTIKVQPVPYAIQAGGQNLTTDQIADYLRDSLTYNDVTDILMAIVANPTGLKDTLKSALIEYLKTHTDIPKAVAEGYLNYLDGNHLRIAHTAMYANSPVRIQIKQDLVDFIKNNKDMAKEVLVYYLQHATAADVDSVDVALHQMPTATRQEFKDFIVNYMKTHRAIAQQFVYHIITNAQGSEAADLYNHLKYNNTAVWHQFVDTIHTYVQSYIAANQPQGITGADSAYVANLLHQTVNEHNYVVDTCTPSVDLCDLLARVNALVAMQESTECLIFGPTTKHLTPNGLYLSNTWTGNNHYVTNVRYVITDANNVVKAIMLANFDGTELRAYANPSEIADLYHLAPGEYTATPTAHQSQLTCDSTGASVTFVIPHECPNFNTSAFDVVFSTNSNNNDQFELSFPIDLDGLEYEIPLVSFNNVYDNNDYRNIQLQYDATNKRLTGIFEIASLGTASDPGGYGKTYKVTPMVKVKCAYHDEGDSDTTLVESPMDFEITMPIQCPGFANTRDTLDNDKVAFLSDIQLANLLNNNATFYVIVENDTTAMVSTYDAGIGRVYSNSWLDTTLYAGKTLTFYPTIDVKCGVDTNAAGYHTIVGGTGTVTFAPAIVCPSFAGTPYVISSADGLIDTIAIQLSDYDANIVNSITIDVNGINQSYTTELNATNDIAFIALGTWADPVNRNYYSLNAGETGTFDVTVSMDMNNCTNATTLGNVTLDLPACPAFTGTPTATLNTNDGTVLASFPVSDYNDNLINGGFTVKVYKNTNSQTAIGDLLQTSTATYNTATQSIEYTLDSLTVASSTARFDFIANMNLTTYCDPNTNVESSPAVYITGCPTLGTTGADQIAGNDTVVFHTEAPNVNGGNGGYFVYVMENNQPTFSEIVIPATVTNGQLTTDVVDFYLQYNAKFNGKDLRLRPFLFTNFCDTIWGNEYDYSVTLKCPQYGTTTVMIVNDDVIVSNQMVNYNPALVNGVYPISIQDLNLVEYPTNPGTISSTGLIQTIIPRTLLQEGLIYKFAVKAQLTGLCASTDQSGWSDEICIPYSSAPSFGASTPALNDLSLTVTTEINDYEANRLLSQGFIASTNNTAENVTVTNSTMEKTYTLTEATRGTTVWVVPFMDLKIGCDNNTHDLVYGDTIWVCVPFASKPTFTTVTTTNGLIKQQFFANQGVVLMTKINDYSTHSSNITKKGYLLSRNPITDYDPNLCQVVVLNNDPAHVGSTGDSLIYTVGIDSCGGYIYYRPFVLLNGCDSVVLGGSSSDKFGMWAPDFTISAPTLANGHTMLTAEATMTVGQWSQFFPTYNEVYANAYEMCPLTNLGCPGDPTCDSLCHDLPATTSNTQKTMEEWVDLLHAIKKCCVSWRYAQSHVLAGFGMEDPENTEFEYRWEEQGGNTTVGKTREVNPLAPTTYTGYSILTYGGTQCVVKQSITVGQ